MNPSNPGTSCVQYALIGSGNIGKVHARHIAAHPRAQLRWVIGLDQAQGEALAHPLGARFTSDLQQALDDPAVSAVVIGSPTQVHEQHLLACIAAGKAVLCEKPIAVSLEQARACADAARAAGLVCAAGFNRRFDVHHRAVYERVRAGTVGAVELMHIVSRSSRSAPPAAAHAAGGMLRDKGTHFFDLACWISGLQPVEVYATGGCLFEPGYADYGDVDTAVVTLRFDNGAAATFSFSRRTEYGYDELIEVAGSAGMLESRRQRELGVSLYRGASVIDDGLHAGFLERFAATYARQIDAFTAAVLRGDPNATGLATLEDGVLAQAVAEAAVTSLNNRQPVPILPNNPRQISTPQKEIP